MTRDPNGHEHDIAIELCLARNIRGKRTEGRGHRFHVTACDKCRGDVVRLVDPPTGREDQCERCLQPNPLSWFVASDIWNHVMRRGDRVAADRYGFCCPTCFIELAREAGINPPAWELSIPTAET